MGEIKRRMNDPELLKVLLYRTNDYGDVMLKKTVRKISHTEEIADTFGFDSEVAVAIVVMKDLATVCYGETGERFLEKIDPSHTSEAYTERLARKVLHGIDPAAVDTICKGLRNVSEERHTTPEEQIALMVRKGFAFADTLATKPLEILFAANYCDAIIRRTARDKMLTDYVIPENSIPTREKKKLSPEEQENRRMQLETAHQYFAANPQEIPGTFKEGWGEISNELLAAYYVVGTDDKFLQEFEKTHRSLDENGMTAPE